MMSTNHSSLGDKIFGLTERLIGDGEYTLPEYHSAWAAIARGAWSIAPALAAGNLPTSFAAAWQPLRYIWPAIILVVGLGQLVAVLLDSLTWRRRFCMVAIVAWSFSTLLFATIEREAHSGIPLVPVYGSFVVAGILRYVRLNTHVPSASNKNECQTVSSPSSQSSVP